MGNPLHYMEGSFSRVSQQPRVADRMMIIQHRMSNPRKQTGRLNKVAIFFISQISILAPATPSSNPPQSL